MNPGDADTPGEQTEGAAEDSSRRDQDIKNRPHLRAVEDDDYAPDEYDLYDTEGGWDDAEAMLEEYERNQRAAWAEVTGLKPEHAEQLKASAIEPHIAKAVGVRSHSKNEGILKELARRLRKAGATDALHLRMKGLGRNGEDTQGKEGADDFLARTQSLYRRMTIEQMMRNASSTIGGEPEDAAFNSWEPHDLVPYFEGTLERPQPTVGAVRNDNKGFLYPGREHAAIGEQRLVEALDVTWNRLIQLFKFVGPERRVRPEDIEALIGETPPTLVILDGQNEAMALHDQDIMKLDGAAEFRRILARPFKRCGAAVLSLDHVVKDPNEKGKGYATGSAHKGNGLDGALFLLENMESFGKGQKGASAVSVTKDRPGLLRQHGVRDDRVVRKTPLRGHVPQRRGRHLFRRPAGSGSQAGEDRAGGGGRPAGGGARQVRGDRQQGVHEGQSTVAAQRADDRQRSRQGGRGQPTGHARGFHPPRAGWEVREEHHDQERALVRRVGPGAQQRHGAARRHWLTGSKRSWRAESSHRFRFTGSL